MTEIIIDDCEAWLKSDAGQVDKFANNAVHQLARMIWEKRKADYANKHTVGSEPPRKLVTEQYAEICGLKDDETTDPDRAGFIRTQNTYVAIEIYDNEIRYDGKTIWTGASKYKTSEEVDAIVEAYKQSTKTTE